MGLYFSALPDELSKHRNLPNFRDHTKVGDAYLVIFGPARDDASPSLMNPTVSHYGVILDLAGESDAAIIG